MRRWLWLAVGVGALSIGAIAVMLALVEPERSVCEGVSLSQLTHIRNDQPGYRIDMPDGSVNYRYADQRSGLKDRFYFQGSYFPKTATAYADFCRAMNEHDNQTCVAFSDDQGRFGYILYKQRTVIEVEWTGIATSAFLRQADGSEVYVFPPHADDIEGAQCNLSRAIFVMNEAMKAGKPVPIE